MSSPGVPSASPSPGRLPVSPRQTLNPSTAHPLWRSWGSAGLDLGQNFLLLDPAVLKPDGDLAFRETGGCRDLAPLVLGDELVGRILPLQLTQLPLAIGNAFFAASAEGTTIRRVLGVGLCVVRKGGGKGTLNPLSCAKPSRPRLRVTGYVILQALPDYSMGGPSSPKAHRDTAGVCLVL